jgi:hypothetical protein
MKRKTKKTKDNTFSLEELKGLLEAFNKHGCEMLQMFEKRPDFFPEEGQKILIEQVQWQINRLKTRIKEKNETLAT